MRLRRDDRGVTLIELLVAIAILGVVVAPLIAAFIIFLRNTNQAQDRLEASHDAQIAGSYFAQDVASVGRHEWNQDGFPLIPSVELNASAGGGFAPCGPPGTPAALIRLSWDDPPQPPAVTPDLYRVAYVLEGQELHRILCQGGKPPVDLVLAHNVVPGSTSVTCTPSCTPSTGPPVPQTVTLTLQIQVTGSDDPPLVVTLTGQRRQT